MFYQWKQDHKEYFLFVLLKDLSKITSINPDRMICNPFFIGRTFRHVCVDKNCEQWMMAVIYTCFNICYSHVLCRLVSGGDQGLLNSFFSSWPVEDISKHLPFVYNLSASSVYSYLPAFQQWVCLQCLWLCPIILSTLLTHICICGLELTTFSGWHFWQSDNFDSGLNIVVLALTSISNNNTVLTKVSDHFHPCMT